MKEGRFYYGFEKRRVLRGGGGASMETNSIFSLESPDPQLLPMGLLCAHNYDMWNPHQASTHPWPPSIHPPTHPPSICSAALDGFVLLEAAPQSHSSSHLVRCRFRGNCCGGEEGGRMSTQQRAWQGSVLETFLHIDWLAWRIAPCRHAHWGLDV